MTKNKDCYCYSYGELLDALDLPGDAVILIKSICPWEHHHWRLETEGPEVFMAVCNVCGKRTTAPEVLLKLLDDFSYERGHKR